VGAIDLTELEACDGTSWRNASYVRGKRTLPWLDSDSVFRDGSGLFPTIAGRHFGAALEARAKLIVVIAEPD
jgi:hypothetical protein